MNKLEINYKYQPLFEGNKNKRFYYITGGRGSGKSFTVAIWICMKMLESKNDILFLRYTMTSAHLSIIPTFLDSMNVLGVTHLFEINKTEILCKSTGSVLYFRGVKSGGGNQTANLKSLKSNIVIFDEIEELPSDDIFNNIQLSIRDKYRENIIVMIQNPSNINFWAYKHFIENGKLDNTEYIHTTYFDNKHLHESFYQEAEAMRLRDEKLYRHVFLGEWANFADNLIYPNHQEGEFDDTIPVLYGLDFGFQDSMAMTKVGICEKTKSIYVKEMIYEKCLLLDDLCLMLDDVIRKHFNDYQTDIKILKKNLKTNIICDSANPQMIGELTSRGYTTSIPVRKFPNSIEIGIYRMMEYKIIIQGDNLKKEINSYIWKNKALKSLPHSSFGDHLLDTVRYCLMYFLRL